MTHDVGFGFIFRRAKSGNYEQEIDADDGSCDAEVIDRIFHLRNLLFEERLLFEIPETIPRDFEGHHWYHVMEYDSPTVPTLRPLSASCNFLVCLLHDMNLCFWCVRSWL